jgi:hypothetical protein
VPYQVIQRIGFDPTHAHMQGSPSAMGHGTFHVRFESRLPSQTTLQYRAVPLKDAFGHGIDWTPLEIDRNRQEANARAPAGGWYRLEIRASAKGRIRASGSVEPVGVGELFLIAGQSNADNCSDERLRIGDARKRVVALNPVTKAWRVAHDPQPTPSTYRVGSIWPPMGDALIRCVRVPIGWANVAVAATASSTWMPGQPNYRRLVEAGKLLGPFRYVLWQQGESDVIDGISPATYVRNIAAIRTAAADEWGYAPTWLLAKSTFHPTVYNNPVGEQKIRDAVNRLWTTKGFAPGPDTDVLGGDLRGAVGSQQHFSPQGQRMAGLMWFSAVWNQLSSTASARSRAP